MRAVMKSRTSLAVEEGKNEKRGEEKEKKKTGTEMVVVKEEEATTSGRVLLKASPDELDAGSALHS